MISKVITGKSFAGVCRYLCSDEERAVVLEVEGVRAHNYKMMCADLERQQSLRPTLNKAVFHGILSFYPGEKISDTTMIEVAKEYLQKMNISETQFAIIKHVDKNHPHVHIIANLVNNNGKAIKDNWMGLKGKKVAEQLTTKYGLKQALGKNLKLTHIEQLNERDKNRLIIYQAIRRTIPNCKNLNDLKRQLETHGIETLYKYKGQTEELQGISFQIGNLKYKGSEIDRHFSLKQLEMRLQQQNVGRAIQLLPSNSPGVKFQKQSRAKENSVEHQNIVDILFRTERPAEQLPNNLNNTKRKKRKRLHL